MKDTPVASKMTWVTKCLSSPLFFPVLLALICVNLLFLQKTDLPNIVFGVLAYGVFIYGVLMIFLGIVLSCFSVKPSFRELTAIMNSLVLVVALALSFFFISANCGWFKHTDSLSLALLMLGAISLALACILKHYLPRISWGKAIGVCLILYIFIAVIGLCLLLMAISSSPMGK